MAEATCEGNNWDWLAHNKQLGSHVCVTFVQLRKCTKHIRIYKLLYTNENTYIHLNTIRLKL